MADKEKVIKICRECIEKGSPLGTDAMSYGFYYDVIELLESYRTLTEALAKLVNDLGEKLKNQ